MTWLTDLIESGTTELLQRDGSEVTQLVHFKGTRQRYCVIGVADGVIRTWKEDGSYDCTGHAPQIDLVPPKKRYFHCTNYKESVGEYLSGDLLTYEQLDASMWYYVQEVTIEPVKGVKDE